MKHLIGLAIFLLLAVTGIVAAEDSALQQLQSVEQTSTEAVQEPNLEQMKVDSGCGIDSPCSVGPVETIEDPEPTETTTESGGE